MTICIYKRYINIDKYIKINKLKIIFIVREILWNLYEEIDSAL